MLVFVFAIVHLDIRHDENWNAGICNEVNVNGQDHGRILDFLKGLNLMMNRREGLIYQWLMHPL